MSPPFNIKTKVRKENNMRILLRKFGDEAYVWKDATYENGCYFITTPIGEQCKVDETAIASVDGDENKGWVICQSCGALIKNTPEAIAAHYAEMESKRDCTKCSNVTYPKDKKIIKREMVYNGDGTYRVKEEFDANLLCGITHWNTVSVSTAIDRGICKFMACRVKGVQQPDDIFARFPDVFDKAITVDALIAKKFKLDGFDRYFLYDMKSRGTIKACVNEKGIVECFNISSKGRHVLFYYSEKYDKMFYKNGTKYVEGAPYWFAEKKFEEAHQKIKELYKGAE